VEDWFVSWFNSPYYHLLYKDRDEHEAAAFIQRLCSHLELPKGSKVLDLACGKGRHALQLHRLGYDVTGVDIAPQSIDYAQRVHEQSGLRFHVHDMRMPFATDRFHLVVNLFTSFGYFHNREDDARTIRSVAAALRPGGRFVIDFMNVVKVQKNLVPYEEKQVQGVRFTIWRSVENGIIHKRIHVQDKETELDFEEQVDAIDHERFSAYFDQAGLRETDTFGDYQLNPFDAHASDRLIMIGTKP